MLFRSFFVLSRKRDSKLRDSHVLTLGVSNPTWRANPRHPRHRRLLLLPSQDPVGSIAPSPSCSVSSSAAFLRPRGVCSRPSYAGAITIPLGVLLLPSQAWVPSADPSHQGRHTLGLRQVDTAPVSLLFSAFCCLLVSVGFWQDFCWLLRSLPDFARFAWFPPASAGLCWLVLASAVFWLVLAGASPNFCWFLLEFSWGYASLCWLASAGLCCFLLEFSRVLACTGFRVFNASLSSFLSLQLNVKTS